MSAVALQIADGAALIRVSESAGGPVSVKVRQGLWEALEIARAETAVKGIVILGLGSDGVASVFAPVGDEATAPDLLTLARRIERCEKPVVVGLHQHVAGDALALTLACHFRLAEPDASFVFPQAAVPVPPPGGAVQRLVRLAGAGPALGLLLDPTPVSAKAAEKMGLIDGAISGNLQASCLALARDLAQSGAPLRPTYACTDGLADPAAFQAAIAQARAGTSGTASRIVDTVEAAQMLPFEQALAFEAEARAEALAAASVRQTRYLSQAEKRFLTPEVDPAGVSPLGLVGGGPRGVPLAVRALAAGLDVRLLEQDADHLAAAMGQITDQIGEVPGLRGVTTMAELAPARLLVETLPDESDLKPQLVAHLQDALGPDGVVLSLSETIPLAQVGGACADPSRVAGFRMSVLPDASGLAELAGSGAGLLAGMGLAGALGLRAVACDGPAASRLWAACEAAAHVEIDRGRARPETLAAAFAHEGFLKTPQAAAAKGPPALGAFRSCILAMVSAGADLMADGVLATAADVDLVAVHGLGVPRAWGGVMFWGDELGLTRVAGELTALRRETGEELFRPSALITELARQGLRLSDWR